MQRADNRKFDEMRKVKITNQYLMHAEGSVLIEMGNTKVICTASVEDKTAQHLKGTGRGWVTAEYGMLPRSTGTRKQRDASRGKIDGRTMEIQRLIGRSLRSVTDLDKLGERTIWIDCDVIQADGGTRTASITGAFIAMAEAMKWMKDKGMISSIPVKSFVSAVSVGIVGNEILLDLPYEEDSSAKVDMNVVMTDKGEYIEVQGTGEDSPFQSEELFKMLALAEKGCKELNLLQKEIIGDLE
ncbi:ribonuclease PH [Sinanaerobacter chloroacetimidivorans]|jgi:ribonuclease PH|uniref:Ribonuclease PH n=1 Tax=Sinanaerobacter chloroacetimidivorans TaxID=2818044 RepID=A0A8J8B2N7_9FIRM|nr:ribonuclease PH [Sinanaerobacter chloroacetimidivorans]MBR0597430.1 ribonuclease PH [Sinanaerobacter chloroacetimidivorans]